MDENMLDDVSDIAAYYNSDPDREHSRLDQHQLENDLALPGSVFTPSGIDTGNWGCDRKVHAGTGEAGLYAYQC